MRILFLGTGTSIGVPEMCCECAVCRSENPKDKRFRTSLLLETDDKTILLDCGPDFRSQMLRYGVKRIDALLLTHEHYDHVGGIDDLRPYATSRPLPIYAEQGVINHLQERIPYCFGTNRYPGTPSLRLISITPGREFFVGSSAIMPIRVMHGRLPIVGFRIGSMAYITDMKWIERGEMERLKGVKRLIVNALHIKEHPTHQNLMQAQNFARMVGAEETYFIHFSHRIGLHNIVEHHLPDNMHLAYDGLEITI